MSISTHTTRRLVKAIALAGAVSAIAVPAAQAGHQDPGALSALNQVTSSAPVDPGLGGRGGHNVLYGQSRLVAATAASGSPFSRPDDRPGIRTIGASNASKSLRPDDRPGIRGAGTAATS